MANLDTAEKRRSAVHIGRFWMGAGVTPTAGGDQEWRQEVGRFYSGILAAAPPTSTYTGTLLSLRLGIGL